MVGFEIRKERGPQGRQTLDREWAEYFRLVDRTPVTSRGEWPA